MDEDKTTQICNRCQIEKPLEAFQKESGRHNGRRAICRECRSVAFDPKKGAIATTPEALAREEAITELITLHQEHFTRLHYSARVRRGLITPGRSPKEYVDTAYLRSLGRQDKTMVDS